MTVSVAEADTEPDWSKPIATGEAGLMSKPDRAWPVYENDGPVAELTAGPITLVGTAGFEPATP